MSRGREGVNNFVTVPEPNKRDYVRMGVENVKICTVAFIDDPLPSLKNSNLIARTFVKLQNYHFYSMQKSLVVTLVIKMITVEGSSMTRMVKLAGMEFCPISNSRASHRSS
jgi:hypothetical protein